MVTGERFTVLMLYRGGEKDYEVNFRFEDVDYNFTFHDEPYPNSSRRQNRSFKDENTAERFAENLHGQYPELTTSVIKVITIKEVIKKFGK